MTYSTLQAELTALFEQQQYQSIVDRAQRDEITPATDPKAANVVAAALFQLGRYSDCQLWCEGLASSLNGDANFASLHGAVLRRLGRLDDAESVFRDALSITPNNAFLRNNFANLLIDRQVFVEAESILCDLLKENPSYEDAQSNLNRLKFQRKLAASSPDKSSATAAAPEDPGNHFQDPLIAAFSDKEVAIAGGIAANQDKKSQRGGLQPCDLPDRARDQELNETLALARKTIDADPQQAIRDCTLLHNKLGVQAPIYEVAGEAYIRLQLFSDAEASLLIAHGLGSMEGSVALNLANLAAMRGDQKLALHWLEMLAKRQPEHPQLNAVRSTLFPNGTPTISKSPFQVNLDQRAPGHFK